MARTRVGYVAALVAGAAIVGAATFGVNAATTHQADVATAALAQTQASLEAAAESAASAAEVTDQTSPAVSAAPSTASSPPSSSLSSASATTAPAGSGRATATAATAPPASKTTPKSLSAAPAPTPTKAANTYKDGQYSVVTSYDSPGGQEQLGVTLTLKSDKVVKSDLQLLGGAGISHSYQSLFAAGYLPLVLGKDIDSISLGAVSGSSLTGEGFNAAVKKIEEQARAQA